MFTTINEGVVALRSKTLTELKPETEISLEGTFSKGNSVVLDVALDAWLIKETRAPKVLLLQGTAGSGKTQFCQKLTIRLWEQYNGDDNPIPLYISLANLQNPTNKAIEETLENIGFNQEQITILKEKHHFIFILDGYDELYEFINLHLSNRLGEWRAQTIITCRSEALYFIYDYEKYFVPFKANRRLAIGLQQIEIKPLSALQIKEFLSVHIKDNQNGITYEEVTTIPGLSFLIQTPLLLKAVLLIQKYSLLSPKDFYDALIEARFLWQEQKLKLNKLIDRTADFKPYFWSYCKNLALAMQEHETNVITYRQTSVSLFENSSEENVWRKFFKGDNKIQWMYFACPLTRTSNSQVEFIDNCLIDYFATQIRFHDELELFPHCFLATMNEQKETQEIEKHQLPVIGRKLFTNQEEKIQQLVDRVIESDLFKASLFNYIELSKTDERYAIAASNAITGLNFANVSFSGMDLKEIKIPEADLSQGIFDHTNFEGANLNKTSFRSAWLNHANLKNATMIDSSFEEKATLHLGEEIKFCAYSLDGNYFAIVDNYNSITLYDGQTLKGIATFEVHGYSTTFNPYKTYSITFNPYSDLLASGVGALQIWSTTELCLKHTFAGYIGSINSVAFNHSGELLASGGDALQLWSSIELRLKHTFAGCIGRVNSIVFSPSGELLASGGDALQLWSITELRLKHTFGEDISVNSIAFSPSGKLLASGSNKVQLWSIKELSLMHTFEEGQLKISSLGFNSKGDLLAAGGWSNVITLWSIDNLKHQHNFIGHNSWINSITFDHSHDLIASASKDGVRFWYIPKVFRSRRYALSIPRYVTFSLSGDLTVSGGSDQTVHFWSTIGLQHKQELHVSSQINSIAFNHFGSMALGCNGGIQLWSLGEPPQFKHTFNEHVKSCILTVAFNPSGDLLASGGSSSAQLAAGRDIKSVPLSDSGELLIHDYFTIKLWSIIKLQHIHTFHGHSNSIFNVFFNFNDFLVSGAFDNTIKVWSIIELKPKFTFKDAGAVISMAFKNNLLACGCEDGIIRFLSLVELRHEYMFEGHSTPVLGVTFNYSGDFLASGGFDNDIWLWSIAMKQPLTVMRTNFAVISLAWYQQPHNNYQSFIVFGGNDSSVRLCMIQQDNISLLWSSCQATLCSSNTNLEGTNISVDNAMLLKQYGAVGEPKVININEPNFPLFTNAENKYNEKLLLMAITHKYNKLIEDLLKAKIAVNVVNENGMTPLWIASSNGHLDLVEKLIILKADINVARNNGSTPIHVASYEGYLTIVENLIKVKAKINVMDNDGCTPLYFASQQGHSCIVKKLIEAKAEINVAERTGFTSLHRASQKGHLNIVEKLIETKAEINAIDNDGYTPLHMASQEGNLNIVEKLIEAKAELNKKTNKGFTALFIASHNRHMGVVEKLSIASGANVTPANNGNQFLHIAIQNGHIETVERLIIARANVNEVRNMAGKNFTPLHLASLKGFTGAVVKLIEARAIVHTATNDGTTPLHMAAAQGHVDVIERLIEAKAEVNVTTNQGFTPLFLASYKNRGEAVEKLISANANVNVADNDERAPLEIAMQNGCLDIIEKLIKAGAKIN